MKITIEIDIKPEEFEDLFIPSESLTEFQMKTYDAYVAAISQAFLSQIHPSNILKGNSND